MVRKVSDRVKEAGNRTDREAVKRWCRAQEESADDLFGSLDPVLWAEAVGFAAEFTAAARSKLDRLGVDMGGGGDYRILYFLTRYLRPEVVLETGVAAGFTSSSVLTAMDRNGSGHLWSSDFPYFRHANPEADIGVLVDPGLKDRWTLLTQGDRANLPQILNECGPIQLLHYDSDKTASGRAFALDAVSSHLTDDCVVIFDDVDDDFHFRDWSAELSHGSHVFQFGGKHLGVACLGGPLSELPPAAPSASG